MKIAVINEISAADKNADILKALDGREHEVLNLGNTSSNDPHPLLYIHTALMSAILLNLNTVDFVIGGCGTGQGYLNAVLQYPGVVCGYLCSPLDAFLFARINAGNCVALPLNQGYGWAGDVNLRQIFVTLFTHETGAGYPPHRAEPQRKARQLLVESSQATHRPLVEILLALPEEILRPALTFPAFRSVLEQAVILDKDVLAAFARLL